MTAVYYLEEFMIHANRTVAEPIRHRGNWTRSGRGARSGAGGSKGAGLIAPVGQVACVKRIVIDHPIKRPFRALGQYRYGGLC